MKNKKLIVLNSIVVGLSLLSLLLLMVFPCTSGVSFTMFQLMQLYVPAGAQYAVVGYGISIVIIFNVVILAFSILSLLNACGIIKKAKGFMITNIILASLETFTSFIVLVFFLATNEILITTLLFATIIALANIVLSRVALSAYKKSLKARETAQKPVEEVNV